MSSTQLLTAAEAAAYLRISLATLYRMERRGKLIPFRTLGGHRRYTVSMLSECLEDSRVHKGSASRVKRGSVSQQG
jgi:excisionase family DNA binding protein